MKSSDSVKATKPHENHVVIYFDEFGKSRQVVHPTNHFDNNWHRLVLQVTNGVYHSYKVV